jgi:hypothetical protein
MISIIPLEGLEIVYRLTFLLFWDVSYERKSQCRGKLRFKWEFCHFHENQLHKIPSLTVKTQYWYLPMFLINFPVGNHDDKTMISIDLPPSILSHRT